MLKVRMAVVLGLMLVLSTGALAAEKAKKGKGHHGVRGVVTAVSGDAAKGTIEIKEHAKKNAPAGTEPTTKTFNVNKETTYEKVSGKGKGDRTTEPATFDDVKEGRHVAITPAANGTDAAKVTIVEHAKGKKKNT